MTRRPRSAMLPTVRRRALPLALAYAGVAAVVFVLLLLRASRPGPRDGQDVDNLIDPCKASFLPSQRHVTDWSFRKQRGAGSYGCVQVIASPVDLEALKQHAPRGVVHRVGRLACAAERASPARARAVGDRSYQKAVWDALAPGYRHIDRFAATKNWDAYAPKNSSSDAASSSVDVVLAIQCSPDRCDATGKGSAAYCPRVADSGSAHTRRTSLRGHIVVRKFPNDG